MNSIRLRLLIVSSLILLAFVLITGFALQAANGTSASQAQQERMQGLVYALLGAIEIDGQSFVLNEYEVPEPRLASPDSGLFATVADTDGTLIWQSTSSLDASTGSVVQAPGQWSFSESKETNRFSLSFGFRWLAEENSRQFTITVLESMDAFLQREAEFRRNLWLWLLVPAGLLLAIQLITLAWAMRPLKQIADEIREVESGEDHRIDGNYPAELHPLQGALNTLLSQEHSRQKRYRQALDDLAHSLKTPLAVIRNLVHSNAVSADKGEIAEQTDRMQQIISRQLNRAAWRSKALLAAPINLREPLEAVMRSLQKVYDDKHLEYRLVMDVEQQVRIDQADLYEVLGNLLDNASKWAQTRVTLLVERDDDAVSISISDDGPGFPVEAVKLMERGLRADMQQEGQGLGLAMASEIASAAGGELTIDNSSEQGGRVILRLPSG